MCNICLLNIWPLTVTLTLSWHMGNMGSAHPLVEVNVLFKFEWNPSISKGVIEQTRIGDGPTDRPTDVTKRIQYSPPTFCGGGIKMFVSKFTKAYSKIILFFLVSMYIYLSYFCSIYTIYSWNSKLRSRMVRYSGCFDVILKSRIILLYIQCE